MDKQDILEGNKIIGEFMGVKIGEDKYSYRPGTLELLQIENLAYDSNWNWLMPVVEKIRFLGAIDFVISIGGTVVISWDDGTVYYRQVFGNGRKSIETVWESVVGFIKWYNEQKSLAN